MVMTIEELKVEVDHLRLQNEKFNTFLRRWEVNISPKQVSRERSREFASQFSQMAIKTMFLLNGGAIIALPAFAQLVDASIAKNSTAFLLSVSGYILGLLLIAATTLLAYTSMDVDKEIIDCDIAVSAADLNSSLNEDGKPNEEQLASIEAAESRKVRLLAKRTKQFRWAMCMGIGSAGAFLLGAGFAGVVLTST